MEATTHIVILPSTFYINPSSDPIVNLNNSQSDIGFVSFIQNTTKRPFNYKEDESVVDTLMSNTMYVDKSKYGEFVDFNITHSKRNSNKHEAVLITGSDLKKHFVTKVKHILKLENNSPLTYVLLNLLTTLLHHDELHEDDYVYIKRSTDMSSDLDKHWSKQIFNNLSYINNATGYFVDPAKKPIHYQELLYHSGTSVIDKNKYFKLKSMVDTDSDMVCTIIDNCKIFESIIPILLLLNRMKILDAKSYKKKLIKISNLIDCGTKNVDNMIEIAEKYLLRKLTAEELEFIADEYYNPFTEQSNMFEFKLKVKKKK